MDFLFLYKICVTKNYLNAHEDITYCLFFAFMLLFIWVKEKLYHFPKTNYIFSLSIMYFDVFVF